jgi:hypothetical protein
MLLSDFNRAVGCWSLNLDENAIVRMHARTRAKGHTTKKYQGACTCTAHRIIREITRASASTTRGHFGCIFKAIADCAA